MGMREVRDPTYERIHRHTNETRIQKAKRAEISGSEEPFSVVGKLEEETTILRVANEGGAAIWALPGALWPQNSI